MVKRGKKEHILNRWLLESLDYIRESNAFIWTIVGIFAFAGFAGFTFAEEFRFLDDLLREIIEQTEGLGALDLITFIFANNVHSAFIGLVLGVFLGLPSLLNALMNGVVIGYVLNGAYQISGIADFWRLLPHGIFELPAIFISLGLGLKLGLFIFADRKKEEFKRRMISGLKAFVTVIIPLLVIAAIIEGILIASGI